MATRSQVSPLRIRLLFICFLLFALVLAYKLYMVQIVRGEDFSTRADRQYLKPSSTILNRGSIYFRTKDNELVTAAHQQSGYRVAINPTIISNPEDLYNKLSAVVPVDKEDFMAKANKKNDPYEEIIKKVDLSVGEKIKEIEITGLQVYKEKWRFYPSNQLGAHLLGFLAYKDDDLAGRYGLESFYEKTLRRSRDEIYANFFVEMFSNIQKSLSEEEEAEGDIVTSIEPTVQAYLEHALEIINNNWSSDYSGGIVMNPKNGEIVAMSVYPSFNPNTFQNQSNPLIFTNKLVENVYEMGSIIKPLTVAAGIDSGAITPQTTYYDAGFLTLNKKTISNYDGRGRGYVDMQQVLNQSLNTGVAFVADKMGKDNFSKYMKGFGLSEKTGIDLPYEAAPLTENLNSPRDIEHATASYGQGIAMTPVATIRALSALANGGTLVTPHVVSKINFKTGLSRTIYNGENRRVLKEETSEKITKMLVRVVDEALLEGKVKMEHYSIAAKTGTAQIARTDGRGYYEDRYLHSFFGYFPAYDPQYIVFLYTYYPKGVKYASETLTHSFIDLAKYLINYYDIPPDR